MSAATMSGTDAVKTASTSNKPLKSSNSGKALDGARKQAASPVDGQSRKQQSQPKAWQGPNPITQRASTSTSSNNMPNGTEKPLPKLPQQPQSKSSTESNGNKHAHDRALFLIANFIGQDATLTLKTGEQFTGVFSGASLESTSKHQYILKMVKRTRMPSNQQVNGNDDIGRSQEYVGEGDDHVMVFDKEDTVDLAVPDVVTASAQPVQNGSITSSFRTDTEISSQATNPSIPRARELQRWDAGSSDINNGIDMSLESSSGGWDQFATNERMYGVQSTYDENIYTTQIDRNTPGYRQREAEAARIAREIEGSTPADAHVAEERRRDAPREDGAGGDEEEKYSGVRRDAAGGFLPKRSMGAYVPPSQRPLTNTPTVPGAPFDPAIISIAKPTPPPAAAASNKPVAIPRVEEPPSVTEKPQVTSTDQKPKDTNTPTLIPPPTRMFENSTDDHVRNVNDAFKQFANSEKLRIRNAQAAKKESVKLEKNVKINDLKKFAANFKLKSRVPDDLVPILAKDREKQVEIQNKADEAAKEEEIRAKEREREKAKAAGASSPAPATPAQVPVPAPAPITDQRTAQHKARMSQNFRAGPVLPTGPLQQSPGKPLIAQQQANRAYGRPHLPPQPLPTDLRIPVPQPQPVSQPDAGPLSPTTSARLNVNAKAFEFRPAASAFTPTGTSPSPQRSLGSALEASTTTAATESGDFFDGSEGKKKMDAPAKDFEAAFNCTQRGTEEQKKAYSSNGGVPQPYRTPPTWPHGDGKQNASYKDGLAKSERLPTLGVGIGGQEAVSHSPMHTPNHSAAHQQQQMPHAHQLPPHLQGPGPGPQASASQHRQPAYMPPPHHAGPPPVGPQAFDPRMHFGPNGSVQSSPRFPQAQMAAYGMPPQAQFGGPVGAGGYGMGMGMNMSPSMQYRQPHMQPGPGAGGPGPMMMGPPQGYAQGYARGGPQQQHFGPVPPQMMAGPGGVPMAPQHSSGGGGGVGPGGFPMGPQYSPMPPHAQPHSMYTGSPRPSHMMQHSGSHQGYQPHMGPMGGMPGGPGGGYGGPGGGWNMSQRQMSHGPYVQMTPRQQHAMPQPQSQQPSPGMMQAPQQQQQQGQGQGDEGK